MSSSMSSDMDFSDPGFKGERPNHLSAGPVLIRRGHDIKLRRLENVFSCNMLFNLDTLIITNWVEGLLVARLTHE